MLRRGRVRPWQSVPMPSDMPTTAPDNPGPTATDATDATASAQNAGSATSASVTSTDAETTAAAAAPAALNRRIGNRQGQRERGPLPRHRLHRHLPAVLPHHMFDDAQPQARAAGLA